MNITINLYECFFECMYMYLFLYTSMRSKRCFKNPQQNPFLCLCRCQISVILYTKSTFLEKIKLYNFDVMRSNFVSNFVFFNSLGILREWKDYRFGKIFPKLIFLSILTKATFKVLWLLPLSMSLKCTCFEWSVFWFCLSIL